MSVSGRIAVDLEFTDRTSTVGGSSLNTITLREATEYTTGKVAIVTGTVGTVAVSIARAAIPYVDASGATVSMTTWNRVALASSGFVTLFFRTSFPSVPGPSSNGGRVAIGEVGPNFTASSSISLIGTTAGTASYTLVIYGS